MKDHYLQDPPSTKKSRTIELDLPMDEFVAETDKLGKRLDTFDTRLAALNSQLQKIEEDTSVKSVKVTELPAPDGPQAVTVTNPPVIEKIDLDPLLKAVMALGGDIVALKSELAKLNPQVTVPPYPNQLNITNLPTGEGDNPKKTDPSKFVPVRLTDGKSFYKALEHAMASASGGGHGKPWTPVPFFGVGNTVQLVSTAPLRFGGYFIYNPNATVAYLQLFDVSDPTTVNLGVTKPKMPMGIPTTAGANVEFDRGVEFLNGLQFAFTTTASGSTNPSTGLDGFLLISDR